MSGKDRFEEIRIKCCELGISENIFILYIAVRGIIVVLCQTMNAVLKERQAEKPWR